jgi:hypothetical protein
LLLILINSPLRLTALRIFVGAGWCGVDLVLWQVGWCRSNGGLAAAPLTFSVTFLHPAA